MKFKYIVRVKVIYSDTRAFFEDIEITEGPDSVFVGWLAEREMRRKYEHAKEISTTNVTCLETEKWLVWNAVKEIEGEDPGFVMGHSWKMVNLQS